MLKLKKWNRKTKMELSFLFCSYVKLYFLCWICCKRIFLRDGRINMVFNNENLFYYAKTLLYREDLLRIIAFFFVNLGDFNIYHTRLYRDKKVSYILHSLSCILKLTFCLIKVFFLRTRISRISRTVSDLAKT